MQCRICSNTSGLKTHQFSEMMLGLRDKFNYWECPACGCIQSEDTSIDVKRYYPPHYYSYNRPRPRLIPIWKIALNSLRLDGIMHAESSGFAHLAAKLRPLPIPTWLAYIRPGKKSRILDVGCGAGHLLLEMRNWGYQNLFGIDPYIRSDETISNVSIRKSQLHEVTGSFDLLMFHHVLEHLADPLDTLKSARRLLAIDGRILIRIPVAGKYAWRTYGRNWVQLDAPRHLFLHSELSIEILARSAGLKISKVLFDSTAFQFWASEQYAKGIPLNPAPGDDHPTAAPLKPEEFAEFTRLAERLNMSADGDQAAFILEAA